MPQPWKRNYDLANRRARRSAGTAGVDSDPKSSRSHTARPRTDALSLFNSSIKVGTASGPWARSCRTAATRIWSSRLPNALLQRLMGLSCCCTSPKITAQQATRPIRAVRPKTILDRLVAIVGIHPPWGGPFLSWIIDALSQLSAKSNKRTMNGGISASARALESTAISCDRIGHPSLTLQVQCARNSEPEASARGTLLLRICTHDESGHIWLVGPRPFQERLGFRVVRC